MPFVVDRDRPLAVSLARVARGYAAAARDSLAHLRDGPERAVHDARRDLRAARAAVRLMRSAIGDDAYRAQNGLLRDAGRALSEHRDAHVLARTFDRLAGPEGDPDAAATARLRAALDARPAVRAQPLEAAMASALAGIERFEDAITDWPRRGGDLDSRIAAQLARSLRRVRKRAGRADAEASADALHELRKRAKDARDQLRILMPIAPRRFGTIEHRLDRIASLLGEVRDCQLLADALETCGCDAPARASALRASALSRADALSRKAVAAAAGAELRPKRTSRRLLRS